MNYMVHVSNTMWRIKNQPCNYAACSDSALRLLVLVAGKLYWGLQSDVFIFNLGLHFEGFWPPHTIDVQGNMGVCRGIIWGISVQSELAKDSRL